MGFFSGLFRRPKGEDVSNSTTIDEEELFECEVCRNEVPDSEYYEGLCYDCIDDSQFAKHCCGNIYEEGEVVCASCGDPL